MKTRTKQLLASLLCLILAGILPTSAQETSKLSLDDALKMALTNNANILNSELDLKIAQKKVWETTATGLPHVNAKSAYTFYPKVPKLPASFVNPDASPDETISLMPKQNLVTDLTVSQLIFSGSYIVGLQATKVYYALTEQNNEKARKDVIETVANTYHMLQLAKESKRILSQNLGNIDKTLSEITEMNKQGFVEKTDVDQLVVTGNTIKNALTQIESNLDVGYRLLKIQLGMPDSIDVELADKIESDESLTKSSLQLISEGFNIEQNIDYQLAKTSVKAANLQLKLSKSAYLPTLNAFYDHTIKANKPLLDFQPNDMIGVNLSLPIFSSGEKAAQVAQQRMTLEKAQNSSSYAANSILMQASQYQNDLKLKLEKYRNQKKSEELSDNIYKKTLEKYKQGMASSMDLMNSQNQYLTNLTNYYQSIYDLQDAKSKLEKLYNINQDVNIK